MGEDECVNAFDVLRRELEVFSPELMAKKRVLVGSKMDREGAPQRFEALKKKYPRETVLGISVFTGQGVGELAELFGRLAGEEGKA
jgi:GTP-binding protein